MTLIRINNQQFQAQQERANAEVRADFAIDNQQM